MITCAAILAGGAGTRLSSVIGDRPKALALVAGRPFITYLLDKLEKSGIKMTVLCVGFGAAEIRNELGAWYRDMKLVYSEEPSPLGTGGSLRKALPYLNSESILVLNGDSYCGASLKNFIHWYEDLKFEAGILLTESENISRFGSVSIMNDGRIVSFNEKVSDGKSGLINTGVYLFSKNLLIALPENKNISLEREVFPKWSKERKLGGFSVKSPFIDIGTPESYAAAPDFFENSVKA